MKCLVLELSEYRSNRLIRVSEHEQSTKKEFNKHVVTIHDLGRWSFCKFTAVFIQGVLLLLLLQLLRQPQGFYFVITLPESDAPQESLQLPRSLSLLSSVMRIEPVNYFNGFWVSVNSSSWLCDHTQDL